MKVLNEVREKQDAQTHEIFEPLRDIMFALREYDVMFPEQTYEQVLDLHYNTIIDFLKPFGHFSNEHLDFLTSQFHSY